MLVSFVGRPRLCGGRPWLSSARSRGSVARHEVRPLPAGAAAPAVETRFASPAEYTPTHIAEKILDSRGALEGERKHVTVLFADLKGSMELLADRDVEDARRLLDAVLERMIEAVHHYEGTVN